MDKKKFYIIIVVALIVLLLISGYFLLKNKDNIATKDNNGSTETSTLGLKDIKQEKITSENYEEISKKITEKLGDTEETYYFSYACMYYIMKDGFSQEYMTTQDESLLYKNIYNKTVQNIIDEGKQLMIDNGVTIEQYKQQIENTINQ